MACPCGNSLSCRSRITAAVATFGPTVLNRLLGPIQPENSATRFSAYVSAPSDDDTHPRKMVLNAFSRRGGKVVATQGSHIVWRAGFPKRDGYGPVTPIDFSPTVEDYD